MRLELNSPLLQNLTFNFQAYNERWDLKNTEEDPTMRAFNCSDFFMKRLQLHLKTQKSFGSTEHHFIFT
jgi:uncharacterized protein YijF (DUF1287 family)